MCVIMGMQVNLLDEKKTLYIKPYSYMASWFRYNVHLFLSNDFVLENFDMCTFYFWAGMQPGRGIGCQFAKVFWKKCPTNFYFNTKKFKTPSKKFLDTPVLGSFTNDVTQKIKFLLYKN
jgi:hypothetical protein